MNIVKYILELIYPTKCPFCGRITGRADIWVCDGCIKTLPYTKGDAAVQSFKHISKCVSPLYYDGDVRESIHRYKFGGRSAYGKVYADFIRKTIDENTITCDIITWVPISRQRYKKRGYDQARIIAEALGKGMNIETRQLLVKIRNNKAQSGTGGKEARKANVSGVYAAVKNADIKGKRILLIDDVVTTGSTLSESARVLKENGAAEVFAATLARHKD